jgi:ABC-2 type transport system permease protein
VWRQLLLFAHNFVIYFVLLIVLGTWRNLHFSVLLAVPAMGLIALNVIWASLVIGIFSTRFRDIAPIMQSLTLLLFVLTPIFWTTKSLHNQGGQMSERAKLAELNPLFHYLEIIRGPLIGEHVAAYHWYIVIAITAVGWLLALLSMKKFRSRVPYWV